MEKITWQQTTQKEERMDLVAMGQQVSGDALWIAKRADGYHIEVGVPRPYAQLAFASIEEAKDYAETHNIF